VIDSAKAKLENAATIAAATTTRRREEDKRVTLQVYVKVPGNDRLRNRCEESPFLTESS
jgi:hypothetical protein